MHGFDEFFGNLYHLNAEEEPEGYFYPKDPEFKKKYGPRGVIHSYADGKVEDTGPLNTQRMPTVDAEFLAAAKDFIDRAHKADKPFFVWFNSTRMHVFTHLKPESVGKTGRGLEADGMVEHDAMVGIQSWIPCASPGMPIVKSPVRKGSWPRMNEARPAVQLCCP